MNIDDLKVFVAIAKAGGVHAASEHLHKTQSAVSKALRRLEAELGLQLMDRSGYRARTTAFGDAILRRAEMVLAQLGRLEGFAAALVTGQEESIRIAVHSSLPDDVWASFVGAVTTGFPETIVHVSREEVTGAVRRLERKEVDLAITPWAKREADSLGDAVEIGSLALVNVVAAQRLRELDGDVENLCRIVHQVIVTDSVFDDGLTYGVFEGLRQIRVPDQATKTALIRQGLGWGRVPRHQVAADLTSEVLIEIPAASQPAAMSYPIYCMKLKASESGPVMAALWAHAKAVAARNALAEAR